jgi:hypothetical protein
MSKTPRVASALIVIAVLAACGDNPVRPSNPPPPPPDAISSVRIEGPASVAPGASVQFRLIASFNSGATNDVTSQSTWTSDNASVLSIGLRDGLATGKSRGEVHLVARYQNRAGNVVVLVLEDGTFRLRGRVTESGGGLAGARVDVVAGTGAGLTTTTDSTGSYALYGLLGDVQVEVILDGFEKGRQSIVVTGHTTANVELRPSIEPSDLRGDWRLTLAAAMACESTIPQDAATRSYDVTILQTGTLVSLQFKAPLGTEWLPVTGRVIDRSVTISLPVDDFYYPFYGVRFYSLVETLGPGRNLALSGTLRGERSGSFVAGTLAGEFALYRNTDGGGAVWNRDTACERTDHSFRLDRN